MSLNAESGILISGLRLTNFMLNHAPSINPRQFRVHSSAVEFLISNQVVVGSIPTGRSKITRKYPPCLRSRSKVIGTDVGSTPTLRTKNKEKYAGIV